MPGSWSGGDENYFHGGMRLAGRRALITGASQGFGLAAARRFCNVTGVDYVPELLDRARGRAAAEGLKATFIEGDAEGLPFPDASFDAALAVLTVHHW